MSTRGPARRLSRVRARGAALLFSASVGACSGEHAPATSAPDAAPTPHHALRDAALSEPTPDVPPTYAATYTAIYEEVLVPRCALCHADAYFSLATRTRGYETLVGVLASSDACAKTGLFRVKPGDPEASLLYLKVTTPPCGTLMPALIAASHPLDPKAVEQVHEWIARGALDD